MSSILFQSSSRYLAKVYLWLAAAVALCGASAYGAVSFGQTQAVQLKTTTLQATPAVAIAIEHPIALSVAFLGVALAAALFRHVRGLGPLLFLAFPVVSGILVGPSIQVAQAHAAAGLTLSAHPVRDAGLLCTAAFFGLSAYALASGRNFSGIGGFLSGGLWVLIGALLLNLWLGSSLLSVALAGVGALIFMGFILYDTSNILRGRQDDPLGDAMNLFLDVLNLFLDFLRMFSSSALDD